MAFAELQAGSLQYNVKVCGKCGEYHSPMLKKWVVFSLILVGNKHEIIITQEEISRREIVKVEFMGEKI